MEVNGCSDHQESGKLSFDTQYKINEAPISKAAFLLTGRLERIIVSVISALTIGPRYGQSL